MNVIKSLESEVRSYSRAFPTTFKSAKGPFIYDENGKEYLDFLCGAGSLSYGHNNPILKSRLLDYLNENGIVMSLDLATTAKEEFLNELRTTIFEPRGLDYKVQFPGPTGTNAVEAALKIARKATGRNNIISFTNGFHGVSLGSLPATGNNHHRGGSGTPLNGTTFMPYDGYFGKKTNTIDYVRRFLEDSSSGVDPPAAFILETIQGEGGINVASNEWLQSISKMCKEFGSLLIVDDIQVGCGRTGSFFSFEEAGIVPDMVVLSKALSGFGLPFSLLLIKPEYDIWKPGEHNGTFRGNNLAFLTATEAIRNFWRTGEMETTIGEKSEFLRCELERIVRKYLSADLEVRGKGLVFGVDCRLPELAEKISSQAFKNGLMLERCGADDQVVKLLPPLTITKEELMKAIEIFEQTIKQVVENTDLAIELKNK